VTTDAAAPAVTTPATRGAWVSYRVRERIRVALSSWPVFWLLSFVVAVARRPETLWRPQFFNEDGQIFYLGTWFSAPWTPYAGYLHLVPRLAAYAERAVPVAFAPLVGNLFALAVTAGVATFIACGPLPGDRRVRAAVGLFVVLAPLSTEVLGSLTYVQWYLAIFLFAFVLVVRPSRRWILPLTLAGLTGPFSMISLPVYVIRSRRDRSFAPFALMVAVCAAIQAGELATSARVLNAPIGNLANDLALRLLVAPTVGLAAVPIRDSALLPGLLVAVLAVAAIGSVPRSLSLLLLYVVAAFGVLGVVARPDGGLLTDLAADTRYFFLPATALGVMALVAASRSRRRPAAAALAVVMALGVASNFRLDAWPATTWSTTSSCIGGTDPCTVPVYPSGWSVRWPGAGGTYEPTADWSQPTSR
jgi:hypothetical protein